MRACNLEFATNKRSSAQSPEAARAFLTPDGAVPEIGFIIKQPELATTLEAIAAQGSKGFYEGRVAADLVAGVRAGGGIWTLDDLKSYRVIERKPWWANITARASWPLPRLHPAVLR